MWYDFEKANQNLEEIKASLKKFLETTYNDEKATKRTFEYLTKTIDRIIKKEPIRIEFSKGGDASWYISIFNYLANWIEAEKRTSELLIQELNDSIEDQDCA